MIKEITISEDQKNRREELGKAISVVRRKYLDEIADRKVRQDIDALLTAAYLLTKNTPDDIKPEQDHA